MRIVTVAPFPALLFAALLASLVDRLFDAIELEIELGSFGHRQLPRRGL